MGLFDRFLGRVKSELPSADEMSPALVEQIVQDYGAILGTTMAPAPGCVVDARGLPHPKERIKQALVFALRVTKDRQMQEQLRIGYISLADWQEGVGDVPVGLDLTNIDLNANPMELMNRVVAQNATAEKWTSTVKAEQEVLISELQRLGLWQ